jgi:SAM-dependent methyltransferase
MKNSLYKKYTLILKLTLKNYSLLRIFQILEILQLDLKGTVLDLGASASITNVSNYLNNTENRVYANFTGNESIQINLENYPNKINQYFDNILLMNVLEHIKNHQNCLLNIKALLKNKGILYGSTPFMYSIHQSPNDYLRYTKQFLEEHISENGFENVEVKTLGAGIFCCIYSLIFNWTKKIPLLNLIILPAFLVLDNFVNLFSKNIKSNNPLGYFFIAKKS